VHDDNVPSNYVFRVGLKTWQSILHWLSTPYQGMLQNRYLVIDT
jgi:hypothetical protein